MKVLLHNKELWQKFKEHQTEMMVTNSGRRMCPVMSVAFEDLKPRQLYSVMIDFVLMDEFRYSFDANHNRWVPNWRALAEEDCPRVYIHPETPATGASLMQNVLTFKMLKLTNSFKTASKSAQAILVSTMRRYVPRVMVVESANGVYFDYKLREEFYFPETEFMAVSQYRNKQITKLKIDANPFASAYRSEGLHGQAKRRRIESKTASEDWKDWITPEDGPPSNNSSLEEPGINSDEPDAENNSSSSEFVDEPSPEESVISDEQQANGKNPASPCQTGLRKEVSDAHNSIQDGTHKQENSSTVSQVMQIQLTNQTSESESQLSCGESPEWIWGFDEQMSLRYASENQMEGIVKQGDRPGNAAGQNANDAANEAAKVAANATVNRRKKYLPRRLQRTSGVSSTNVSSGSKDNEETVETEPVKEPTVNQVDTLSSQPNDTICDDNSKTEQLCSSDATAQSDAASSCLEEAEKPSITCNNSPKPQTINSHTDSILSRFRSAAGLLSVIGQEVSRLACSDSGKSSVTPAKRSAGPKNKKDSSLNALIQMCSEAEGSLGSRAYLPRSVRPWGTVSRDIFSKNVDGTPASQDISSRESEEESGGFSTSPGGDSSLFEEAVAKSTTSSDCQLSQESDCDFSVSLTSEVEERTRPSPSIPTSSPYNGHVISTDIVTTPLVVSSSSSSNNNNNNNSNTNNHNNNNNNNSSSNSRRSRSSNSSRNSLTSDTIDKSTTTTDQCQTDSTADTKAKSSIEDPIPAALETFSGYYVLNGLNSRQAGARPIVPAPTQSVNICSDDPATDASANSSCCSNSTVYPIIVNSFSINESIRSAVAHQGFNYQPLETEEQPRSSNTDFTPSQNSPPPQVNREYFPSPNSHQTGHSDFIALDNTVLMQAFSLEKFYSFSAPEKQARAPCLRPQTRHYKATRTNFSRLSLEPICSVIHPLTSSTHQSTSQKSAAEVAAQRAWGWWIR